MTLENEKEKRKVWFTENVRMHTEARMLCNINGDTFHSSTKNTWIGNSVPSCHITNDNTGLFVLADIYELIQGSSSVTVRVDNADAIFMVSNITSMSCTKLMDIWYKYVDKYFEDEVIKIVFVKSAENDSRKLIKNLIADLHKKHSKKMVGEKL